MTQVESNMPAVGDIIKCPKCDGTMIYGNIMYNLSHHGDCIQSIVLGDNKNED